VNIVRKHCSLTLFASVCTQRSIEFSWYSPVSCKSIYSIPNAIFASLLYTSHTRRPESGGTPRCQTKSYKSAMLWDNQFELRRPKPDTWCISSAFFDLATSCIGLAPCAPRLCKANSLQPKSVGMWASDFENSVRH
jgi:hypothetical protein